MGLRNACFYLFVSAFQFLEVLIHFSGLPWWLSSKESASAGDSGWIPESGRSPGGGNSNPPQTLAWEIPWSEERVGHDCATKQQQIRVSTSNLKFVFIEEI